MSSTGYEPQQRKHGRSRRDKNILKFRGNAEKWPMFKTQFLADQVGEAKKAIDGADPYCGLSYSGSSPDDTSTMNTIHIGRLKHWIESLKTIQENLEIGLMTADHLAHKWKETIVMTLTANVDQLYATPSVRKEEGSLQSLPSISEEPSRGDHVRQAKSKNPFYKKRSQAEQEDHKEVEPDHMIHEQQAAAKILDPDMLPKSINIAINRLQKKLDERQQDERLQSTFNGLCEAIYKDLHACLTEVPLRKIANHKVAYGDGLRAWNALTEEYEGGTGPILRNAVDKFLGLKQENIKNPTLANYLYEFHLRSAQMDSLLTQNNDCTCHCCSTKRGLPDVFYTSVLLKGTNKSYEPIKVLLDAKGDDLSIDEAIDQLKTFRDARSLDKHKGNRKHHHKDQAFYSQEKQSKGRDHQSHKHFKDRKLKCFNCNRMHAGGERKCTRPCGVCGKTGHVRFNCPTRAEKKQKTNKDSKKDYAAMAKEVTDLKQQLADLTSAVQQQDDEPTFGFMLKEVDSSDDSDNPIDKKEQRCMWCMVKTDDLRSCQQCNNPLIVYCSDDCADRDSFEHWQFCTAEAKQEWWTKFFVDVENDSDGHYQFSSEQSEDQWWSNFFEKQSITHFQQEN